MSRLNEGIMAERVRVVEILAGLAASLPDWMDKASEHMVASILWLAIKRIEEDGGEVGN